MLESPLHNRTKGSRPALTLPSLAVGKAAVWVCLVIVVEVAVGHGLQLAAENTASRVDASDLAPLDTLHAAKTCAALDQHVQLEMTIDELRDLQDQLCPILSAPQRTGN